MTNQPPVDTEEEAKEEAQKQEEGTSSTEQKSDKEKTKSQETLPNTATNHYHYILMGLVLMIISFVLVFRQRNNILQGK
ncbi:LPXTG cell wall anchor domain-containing protein [Alkalihalobacillus sp. 1P02AB]|uniref:LPXTG cell wall anchor domain-containing protein n=1 Tax=Alkalihalobacillus sp. 1P02AB TaxID=3132260 RepID=UPI0039A6348B